MATARMQANGLSFAVDAWGEGGTAALLLHGFPEARQAWRGIGPRLAALGWRVLAPDLRGYGDSDRPEGRASYEMKHLVDDVVGLFQAAGAGRRILVGHDWGGVIAWAAALSGRVGLDGLVILNAPHPARFREVLQARPAQLLKSWYVGFFQLPAIPEMQMSAFGGRGFAAMMRAQAPSLPADLLEIYRRNIAAPRAAKAMIDYYRANAAGLSTARASDAPLAVPTLILWGERDRYLETALAEGNERLVADLTVQRFPEASHWIAHEAETEVVMAIASWARDRGLA